MNLYEGKSFDTYYWLKFKVKSQVSSNTRDHHCDVHESIKKVFSDFIGGPELRPITSDILDCISPIDVYVNNEHVVSTILNIRNMLRN
ncbi:MAG: hypothetical protein HRT90_07255 [Candidatus Margulisbacteria bacterium]|nr:hypothetical protein [Candidatus Margulisiibacteriota bacterium]